MARTQRKRERWLIAGVVAAAVFAVVAVGAALYFRPTTVPDVTLAPIDEARATIEAARLRVGTVSELATSAVGSGRVVSQSRQGGSSAPSNSSIELTVAAKPSVSGVPDVTGSTEDQAQQALSDALYLAVAVDVFDDPAKPGTVVGQAPSAGVPWSTGQPVAIAVAAGPDDGSGVSVPDLSGKTLSEAQGAVDEAGLAVNGLIQYPSRDDGRVGTQLPAAGTVVKPGTTVLVLIVQE